jgi:dihydrofolate reductase
MKISLIVVTDKKRGIGKNGLIPWHISEDFKRFKEVTTGHPIIMGRKTWESLPIKPLPGRTNIIVTQNSKLKIKNAKVTDSIKNAIEVAKKQKGAEEVFIIGGGQIFNQAIDLADKLYLTKIHSVFNADTFFPDYDAKFKKIVFQKEGESNGLKYTFLELEK